MSSTLFSRSIPLASPLSGSLQVAVLDGTAPRHGGAEAVADELVEVVPDSVMVQGHGQPLASLLSDDIVKFPRNC